MLRHGVSVSGDVRIDDRTTLQLGAGGTPGGILAIDGGSRHTIGPGWLAFGGVGVRLLDGRGAAPFLLMSASLAFSSARTTDEADPLAAAFLTATDLRAGLTVGKTFFSALGVRVAPRVLGPRVLEGSRRLDRRKRSFSLPARARRNAFGGRVGRVLRRRLSG